MGKMNFSSAFSMQPPWLHGIVAQPSETERSLEALVSTAARAGIYRVRGENCTDRDACYDEIARTMEFPQYFGRNLNALLDCLTDGDVVCGHPVVVIVSEAQRFLVDESSAVLAGFLDTFSSAAERWAQGLRWPWNTGPTPFHIYFLFHSRADAERYRSTAGSAMSFAAS
jgi:RNAse (barnase) inhibitor barstar